MITVKMDNEKFSNFCRDVVKRKGPWMVGKGVGLLALQAKEDVQEVTKDRFDLHSDFVPKGVWSMPKGETFGFLKSQVKSTGQAQGAVFTAPIISKFMPKQEFGGTVSPPSGAEAFSVPPSKKKKLEIAKPILTGTYRTPRGRVRRQWYTSALLEGYSNTDANRVISMMRTKNNRRKPFTIVLHGTMYVVRRKDKRQYPLELIYIFKRELEYQEIWGFEDTVYKSVDKNYKDIFRKVYRESFDEVWGVK